MKNLARFENEAFELFREEKVVIIKDKNTNSYYELSEKYCKDVPWEKVESKVGSVFLVIWSVLLGAMFICTLYITFQFQYKQEKYIMKSFLIMMVFYSLISIIIHELSHIAAFHFLGRNFDKIGFKINYIFPSFYVKMNDVYMLPQNEKFIVHSAGIFINLLVNCTIFLVALEIKNRYLIAITQIFGIEVMWNVIPILDSDGYKILLTFLKKHKKKIWGQNSKLVKLLFAINIVFSAIYLYNFFISILLT